MKQKDMIVLLVIVFIAGFASYFVSKSLFSGDKTKVQVKRVQAIDPDFNEPSDKYYNGDSVNPTQTITIGDTNPTQNPPQ